MLAEAWLGTGAAARPQAVAAAAVAADPYDERSRRALMRAYVAGGEPARALAGYAGLRDVLEAELGADPAAETQDLHLAILREEEPRAPDGPGRGPGAGPGPGDGADPAPARPRRGSRPWCGVIPGLGTGTVAATPGGPVAVSAGSGWAAAGTAGSRAAAGTGRPGGAAGVVTGTGGVATRRPPVRWRWPALPGRDAEMARLREPGTAANSGQPALILICGEAGIGKTRLAAELAAARPATGGTVLAARCYETERSLFLQPLPTRSRSRSGRSAPCPGAGPGRPARRPRWPGWCPRSPRCWASRQAARPPGRAGRRTKRAAAPRFEAVTAFVAGLAAEHAGPAQPGRPAERRPGHRRAAALPGPARPGAAGCWCVATVRAEEGAGRIDALAAGQPRLELGPLPAAAVADLAAERRPGRPGRGRSWSGPAATPCSSSRRCARSAAGDHRPPGVAGGGGAGPGPAGRARGRDAAAGGVGARRRRSTRRRGRPARPDPARGRSAPAPRPRPPGCSWSPSATTSSPTTWSTRCSTRPRPRPTRVAYHRQAADLLDQPPRGDGRARRRGGGLARAARGWLLAGEQALARAAVADAAELLTRSARSGGPRRRPRGQGRALLARGRALEMPGRLRGGAPRHRGARSRPPAGPATGGWR